ncbi:MAG: hypothetical protein IPQ07_26975 [Myxococcales bacterium]|nr:hypothetical protein [Myxococcales bacterium]
MGKKHTVPTALAQVVANAAARIDGKYCYGLPHYGLSNKLELQLVKLGDIGLFEDNEIEPGDHPDWLPFATLGEEPQFLTVSTQPPYAVGMWEHENGKIYTVWPAIEDFLGRVVEKSDKTPFEVFEKLLDKVGALVEKDKHAEALKIIKPAIDLLPMPANASYEADDDLARGWNLYGLTLQGCKQFPEARAAFEMAAKLGEEYAVLNILDILSDHERDFPGVIARGLELRKSYLNDYARVWLRRYLAAAYLELGDLANAEAELRGIVLAYAISDAEKVREARAGVEKYIADGRPHAETAKGFLGWLKEKSYEVTPAQAKQNQAWWKALPEGARAKLMEEINREDETPTAEDIARCLDVDSLQLDEDDGSFTDLAVFLRLQNVTTLGFYGEPASIEELRGLPRLERLTINNTVIKDFLWPSPADRALWAAATAGDRKGVEKALAAGGSVTARGDHGATALTMAAQTHDLELCTFLVGKGADPWAGDHGESNALYFFASEGKQALEEAAAKAGITHPDKDAYRELSVQRMPKCATFEKPDVEIELGEGEPVGARWPASGAKAQMEPPKKDSKLYDVMRSGYRNALVSEKVAAVLRGEPNLELLPVTLIDQQGKPRPEKYFFLNPLAIDCLQIEKCFPQWNHIDPDSASEIAAFVIDPAKVGAANLFRPTIVNSRPMIVTRALAEKLQAFEGFSISYLKR